MPSDRPARSLREEHIAAIEARAEEATPEPWCVGHSHERKFCGISFWETPVHVGEFRNRGNAIATVGLGGPGAIKSDADSVQVNAQFIAHSRADIPWLLSELRTSDAALKACEARVVRLREALAQCLTQAEGCFANHYGDNPETESIPEHIALARAAMEDK